MNEWLLLAPLGILALTGLGIMLVDAFAPGRAELASVTTTALLMAGLISVVALVAGVQPDQMPATVRAFLAVDHAGLFSDVVICGGAALSTLLAGGYLEEHHLERGEYYVLVIFSTLGAMILARASDVITLFIGLETMSLGVYCMIAYRRTSTRATEGALKYFLLGSFAAAILLFGTALLYGATGHTELVEIGRVLAAGGADARLVLLALALIVVGLAFKVSAVPFHMWTPDAYEGAPTPTTTFMAVAVKTAGFAIMLRVLITAFGDPISANPSTGWPPLIAGIAVITMIYGNVAGLAQTSVKRMLAYSSIAHAGYILVAVAVSYAAREQAVASVLYYLMAYTVSNVLAFGSLILLGSYRKESVSYEDLAGAGRRHPLAALPLVLGVLSLMGFPPTAGFFAKYYVLTTALSVGGGMVWVAIILVLSSALGAYYYLKVIVYLFMKEPQAGAPRAVPMRSGYVAFALVLAGYFVIKMGVTPEPYLRMAVDAAQGFLS